VVEDEPLLRELLGSSLEKRGFDTVTAGSASEARRAFRALDPDGVLMDVNLGPGPNGFDLAESLLAEGTGVAIVFLTNLPDPRFVGRDPGDLPPGIAYLRKTAIHDLDVLVGTLDATIRGAADAHMRQDRDPARPFAAMTRRQIEVVQLVALGYTNARIAEERGMTEKAVEKTIARALVALDVEPAPGENLRVALVTRFLAGTGLPSATDGPADRGDAP